MHKNDYRRVREETETVSIRLPKSVVAAADSQAQDDGRTRGNLLARIVSRAVNDRLLVSILETIIDGIQRSVARGNDIYGEEFQRGQLHAAKWVITALLGESRKDYLLDEIRNSGRRIPHSLGRLPSGELPGFDSDAG